MALNVVVRGISRVYDNEVQGPVWEPTVWPCQVLFLHNDSDNGQDITVTIETSSDGGEADYWIQIPFLVCGEASEDLSITLTPGGHGVIMFRPLERYWRIVCTPPAQFGVHVNIVRFADREFPVSEE